MSIIVGKSGQRKTYFVRDLQFQKFKGDRSLKYFLDQACHLDFRSYNGSVL